MRRFFLWLADLFAPANPEEFAALAMVKRPQCDECGCEAIWSQGGEFLCHRCVDRDDLKERIPVSSDEPEVRRCSTGGCPNPVRWNAPASLGDTPTPFAWVCHECAGRGK